MEPNEHDSLKCFLIGFAGFIICLIYLILTM